MFWFGRAGAVPLWGTRLFEQEDCYSKSILKNQVQLITYVDRLAGNLIRLRELTEGALSGLFGGVHLLPFFTPIDGADAGFDPVDHTQVDPRLGDWDDLRALGQNVELVADLIVNHISSDSPQFKDFSELGSASRFAGMFLTYDRVFPSGALEQDLLRIYRPRPGLPFRNATLNCGEKHLLWTTFTPQQLDIDVKDAEGEAYLEAILRRFHEAGIRMIRLDAVGYAIKKPGTNCFMIPETFDFIAELTSRANVLGMEVLVEIHSHYEQQIRIARRVDWVYDFALPPLVLHSLSTRDGKALGRWLAIRPRNCITVLDTHDGIGVIDVGAGSKNEPGLLTPSEIEALVETVHIHSNGQSRMATGAAANNLDLYQVNCTYYDALARNDNEYLIARAIQFFVPGIPQIYYVGFLAGTNDMELLARSGVGRDINRHFYTADEIKESLRYPVVQKLIELIRLRNAHPAFAGVVKVELPNNQRLVIAWENGKHWVKLEVDFTRPAALVTHSKISDDEEMNVGSWESQLRVANSEALR